LLAHSDVVGAWNLLQDNVVGSMAWSAVLRAGRRRNASQTSGSNSSEGAYWEWDDWRLGCFEEQSSSFDQTSISEPVSSQLGAIKLVISGWDSSVGNPTSKLVGLPADTTYQTSTIGRHPWVSRLVAGHRPWHQGQLALVFPAKYVWLD
jgi:hypothetical protein